MDFIATAPAESATTIKNDGWFPDLDLPHCRATMRLDGTVTEQRLTDAVTAAIASVNTELACWQSEQQREGYQKLSDVPAAQVNSESIRVISYRRAIYHYAHADLIEQYRNFDSTHSGMQQAESLETTSDNDRRTARWAISDIQSRSHATVELI